MNGLYIGSFDPFTLGHLDVVKQAVDLFDTVYVIIASNENKSRRFAMMSMINRLQKYFNEVFGEDKVIVNNKYDVLTPDIAKQLDCKYIIRGLRSTSDYLYEENLYNQYKMLDKDLKVIYFKTDTAVSSTFVYELYKRNKDISSYVPVCIETV